MTPGIHPAHAPYYLRRVQVNKYEDAGIAYKEINPKACVDSVWSINKTDWCISFPITEKEGSIFKKDLLGTKQLDAVKTVFKNWVVAGQRDPEAKVQNNVSNTVTVPEGEWNKVMEYIWKNQNELAGVSFVPDGSDSQFPQAPYAEVLMPDKLLKNYGEGIIFASGLIVDIIDTFGDLWKACDTLIGKGEKLFTSKEDAEKFLDNYNIANPDKFADRPTREYIEAEKQQYSRWVELLQEMGYSEEFAEELVDHGINIPVTEIQRYLDSHMFGQVTKLAEKRDIIRRINKFSCKYFNCDIGETIKVLKQVEIFHDWCDITKSNQEVDWSNVKWSNVEISADTLAAASCSGGACEITKI